MPPMRTLSVDKPIKTERTHEENQERAYIAASRRSDRSLEARVESARRASEIHKRRTGRSLRVTEQDVVNEEMYEEEDDDLPLQYRRLTAHLQTTSSDFNRRLAAYLTSQMAMRTALDQAMYSSYGPQANGGSYMPNLLPGQQTHPPTTFGSPTSPTSPFSYRQSPYPTPDSQSSYRSSQHQRPSSIANPQQAAVTSPNPSKQEPPIERRASDVTPVSSMLKSSPQLESQSDKATKTIYPKTESYLQSPNPATLSPFTTSMPPEAQMLLAGNPNPNAAFTSNLMSGEKGQQSFYNFNRFDSFGTFSGIHPSYDGMSQTLAPGALDSNPEQLQSPSSAYAEGVSPQFSPSHDFNLDSSFLADFDSRGLMFSDPPSQAASGQNTPAERDWASYIDTSWD